MAEEQKNTPRTFKWGDNEYLVDDLLKLHTQQEQNYYNFAKDKGQYDEEALQGLRTAIQDRISKVKSGEHFEADGVLASDQVNNIQIQTQKKGLFKKDKYVAQDNTEWAKYYINKLVNKLTPINQKKQSSGYDTAKHGLETYLTAQGLDPQYIFSNMDKGDGTSDRLFAERDAIIVPALNNYLQYIKSKNFDFTNDDNDFNDNYVADLEDFVKNYSTLTLSQKLIGLNKFGAGKAFATAFTSDKYDLSKSNEEIQQDLDEKKKNEAAELETQYAHEYEDYARSNPHTRKDLYIKVQPIKDINRDQIVDGKDFIAWYGDLTEDQQRLFGTYLGNSDSAIQNENWKNAWEKLMNAYRTNTAYDDKNFQILLQGTFLMHPEGFTDLGDGNYLINESISDTGYGITYNPKSGLRRQVYLGDIAKNNETVKAYFRQLMYKWVNAKYGTSYGEESSYVFKEGGIIQTYQLGQKITFNIPSYDDLAAEKAAAAGVSVKTQQARDKYISEDNKSAMNPNTGLTAEQYARIGYAIADLISAGAAFAPGGGTAVSAVTGIFSTIGNAISDFTDDAVTGSQAWKNLGMNLGMDLMGLIPGGGSAAKFGKILKTIKPMAATIIALPGINAMFQNSPEILASWKKAFDGDSSEGGSKLTYQDYMNLLQVLNVAAGGTNVVRNAVVSSKVSKQQPNKVAVSVKDKDGNQKALVLEGDDAKKFKDANRNGESQKFIDNLEGEGNYTVDFIEKSNYGKFWGRDNSGEFHLLHQWPLGRHTTDKAKVFDVNIEKVRSKVLKTPQKDNNNKILTSEYVKRGRWEGDLYKDDFIIPRKNTTTSSEIDNLQNTINSKLTEAQTKVTEKSDLIKNLNTRKQELESKENLTKEEIKELRRIRAKILGNSQAQKGYKYSVEKTTELQNKLQQELATQRQNSPNTQPQMNQIIQDIKQQLGIKKQGGVIDVNKLNKFLNYGKR